MLFDSKGYAYDMRVYVGKDRTHATDTMTAAHATVAGLTRIIQNVGHKLYMGIFSSSPDLFDDFTYEGNELLWHCQTVPKGLKDSEIETG
jgi:hypothetical protein